MPAHLIVGAREEPFLPALLASIEPFANALVVNENSGVDGSPNLDVLLSSAWARRGTLYLDRAPFVDFATARNRCLALHRERQLGPWAAFVDADEVHTPTATRIAAKLDRLAGDVDYVDGYTHHFLQSVDWYTSIERRMAFFRIRPETMWTGAVHETILGNNGKRFALPYLYAHYGYVLPVRRAAEKARQYSHLGAPGAIVAEHELDQVDRVAYFAPLWPLALRYHGTHPPAAQATIASLRATYAEAFAGTSEIVARFQPPRRRIENAVRRANFEYRWRGRFLDSRARAFVR